MRRRLKHAEGRGDEETFQLQTRWDLATGKMSGKEEARTGGEAFCHGILRLKGIDTQFKLRFPAQGTSFSDRFLGSSYTRYRKI